MRKIYSDNGLFFNNKKESRITLFKGIWLTFIAAMKKKLNLRFLRKQKESFEPAKVLEEKWRCVEASFANSDSPVITWIGQATFLIQVGGVNILTDPIFGDLTFLYKRFMKPGIALKKLPKIDYILISHNHRDHMEEEALLFLKKFNPIVCVPAGVKKWFDRRGFDNVIEFSWWRGDVFLAVSTNMKFSFLPAHHWSSRDIWDINKSLWGSWMIEVGGKTIYFAGDSAYSDQYKVIAEKFPKIDVALMPIGPNEPRKEVEHVHLSTEQSCRAFLDLNAENFIPMHWGTFGLGTDQFDEPIVRLKRWWKGNEDSIRNKMLHIVKFGQKNRF